MVKKEREEGNCRNYRITVVCGCISAVILILLMLASSLLSEKYKILFLRREVTAKICLALSAIICAFLIAKNVKEKRFLYALIGEGVILFTLLLTAIFIGFRSGWISVVFDIGIMLFGAFAGTLLPMNAGIQRKGKR